MSMRDPLPYYDTAMGAWIPDPQYYPPPYGWVSPEEEPDDDEEDIENE